MRQHGREFYCEDEWIWPAFFRAVEMNDRSVIVDPFCGIGRVLDAARAAGYRASGRDIVRRRGLDPSHEFYRMSYRDWRTPLFACSGVSVVSNPAYSYVDRLLADIAKLLVRPAALFLPITYLAGKADLLARAPLERVLVCKPRPSCPPPGTARGGGKMDYAVFLFSPGVLPGGARLGWLRRDG